MRDPRVSDRLGAVAGARLCSAASQLNTHDSGWRNAVTIISTSKYIYVFGLGYFLKVFHDLSEIQLITETAGFLCESPVSALL